MTKSEASTLRELLGCSEDYVARHEGFLTGLATLKYDRYEGYGPGESFALRMLAWLRQFESQGDRRRMFEFLVGNLTFISRQQLGAIMDVMAQRIALRAMTCEHRGGGDLFDGHFFFGMSDSAMLGTFRRRSGIPHYRFAYLSGGRTATASLDDMLQELPEEVGTLYLLDDFIGSGVSYIRSASDADDQPAGKLARILSRVAHSKLVRSDVKICIAPYLSTPKAAQWIRSLCAPYPYDLVIDPGRWILPADTNPILDLLRLADEQSGRGYVDAHFRKGGTEVPYLGFGACSLALVLEHNTPNNSLPVLWYGASALFPRTTRHRERQGECVGG